ncbi:unnamed protein product [Parnassius mnemosyne]|uniref:Uncharacterized protein n=1 Tax=Parnassius mnemosyne TaxID=213953 RepID=A0AAV1K6D1_9NEOP
MNYKELLKEAQVHGVKKLAASSHRWQWALALFALFFCCNVVLWIWVQRYEDNPTFVVKIGSQIANKPFPAVVISPVVTFPEHRIDAFIKKLDYPSGFNETYTRKVIQQLGAFFSPDVPYKLADLHNIETILEYNGLDVEASGIKLTESCEETITRCRWRGRIVKCTDIFEMELTVYGFGCVFNGRSLKREMKDVHLQRKTPARKWYGSSGFTSALMLVINQSLATPFDINLSYKWLSLKGGHRYVDLSINGTPITPGTELFVGYSTVGLQIGEETLTLQKDLRRCRTTDESLKYFPVYNRKFCIMEREIKRTFKKCGCSQVVHPRIPGVPVCRARQLQCARHTTVSYGEYDDHCPMTCDTEVDYFTAAAYNLDPKSSPYDNFYDDLDYTKVSIVRVYVMNRNTKMFSRRPYFTRFELFAQLGGIYNVFFSCSVLLVLELVLLMWYRLKTWISSTRT